MCLMVQQLLFVNNIICYDIICLVSSWILHSEICLLYLEAFKICSYIYVQWKEAVLYYGSHLKYWESLQSYVAMTPKLYVMTPKL